MSTARRRTQVILLVAGIVLLYILFFSSEADKPSDFRGKTEAGIKRKHSILSGDISDEELLAQTNGKLQEILAEKDGRAGMTILQGTRVNEGEVAVAGRKTMPKQSPFQQAAAEKPRYPVKEDLEDSDAHAKEHKSADPGEELAREELQRILKRSPMIIFSKSYCPHSKRAKQLLLHHYDIKPAPYVVELDEMTKLVPNHDGEGEDVTLGRKLQDLLGSLTGRKTVPNIMINTQSIGGASEVVAMDQEGVLLDKILKLGGKRIVSAVKLEKDKD